MTRLPEDSAARLAAAAPGGIDYLLHGHAARRRFRLVRPRRTARSCCRVAKVLQALGARLSMVSARQLPAPEEEEEEEEEAAEGEAQAAKPEKEPPRPSAARLSTARPTRSTTTSISAATR